jgi:PAS domain S-box-containing protein
VTAQASLSARQPFRFKPAVIIALVYLGLYTAWLALGASSEGERLLVGNTAQVVPALAAGMLALQRASILKSRARRAWMLFASGLALWAASSVVWMLTEMKLMTFSQVPVESIRLIGYAAFTAGLLILPRQARRNLTRLRLALDMVTFSTAATMLGWLVLVQPLLASAPQEQGLRFWNAVFPITDLLLLVLVINIYLITRPHQLAGIYPWIGACLAALMISDLAFSFWTLQNNYQVGGLIDLGWAIGYAALGLGSLEPEVLPGRSLTAEAQETAPHFGRQLEDRLQSILPLVITFVLGWYTIIAWQIRGRMDVLSLTVTAVLVLALVARQGVAAGETELQKYEMLVSSIAEPAFICSSKGKLILANPALLTSTGRSPNNALPGQPVTQLFEPGSLPADLLQTSLSQGWSGEAVMRGTDGSSFPVYLSLRPIPHFSGERVALAGTAHDLTLQKNQQAALKNAFDQIAAAHHQLEALNEQLEQKVAEKTQNLSEAYDQLEQQNRSLQMLDELKSDFVSLVSHELRAPLTNISGGIELVLNRPKRLPEEVGQSLSLVQVEIQRLNHFVESILDLSALDAGRTPLYPAPLDLTGMLQPLVRQLEAIHNVQRVEWQIPAGLPPVLADDRALASIFFHLIDNAVKYAPEGKITVKAWSDEQRVCVCVADQGPGIAAEALPLIFDKFYRLHHGDAQQVYGHGLGLYIVQRLLQAMNGGIRVENLAQGGTAFTFWLPAAEE